MGAETISPLDGGRAVLKHVRKFMDRPIVARSLRLGIARGDQVYGRAFEHLLN